MNEIGTGLPVSELCSAIYRLVEAKSELETAAESCDSSWDYYLDSEYRAVKSAEERFGEALTAFISRCTKEAGK